MSAERDHVGFAGMEPQLAGRISGVARLVVTSATLLCIMLGCGRDSGNASDTVAVGAVGVDSADGSGGATAQESDYGAANPPSPGFTSEQGTPPAQPPVAEAPADVAARMAPPPPAALVALVSEAERAATARLPAGDGREVVLSSCLICHAATMIEQQHKDTAGWNKTVAQMIAWGAPVPDGKQSVIVAYLAEHYPARTVDEPARPDLPSRPPP